MRVRIQDVYETYRNKIQDVYDRGILHRSLHGEIEIEDFRVKTGVRPDTIFRKNCSFFEIRGLVAGVPNKTIEDNNL